MKQSINITAEQKNQLTPRLTAALQLLSASHYELEKTLNDYALNNPLIEIVPPTRPRTTASTHYTLKNQSTTSLDLHLIRQIQLMSLSKIQQKALYLIITSLDDNGFFKGNVQEIAHRTMLSTEQIHELVRCIKTLDPPGIGATDYKESIIIQLKTKDLLSPSALYIIQNHLSELSQENFMQIKAETGIDIAFSKQLLAEIKKLHPYPAKSFYSYHHPASYIEPDIIISKHKNDLDVSLNVNTMYRINIDGYTDMFRYTLTDADRHYIQAMYREAKWLKSSLIKRYETLLKSAEKIADLQKEYFLYGGSKLIPLQKKELADMLLLHPSTITRALDGKYIKSTQGLQPASFFFSGRARFNNRYSPVQIKFYIKKIIEEENKYSPETDERITAYLNASGINISRRTVAKYRTQLGIAPTSIRRKFEPVEYM